MYEADEEPVLTVQTHCSDPSPCFCQEELSFLDQQPGVGGGGGGAAFCCADLQVLKPHPFSLMFK